MTTLTKRHRQAVNILSPLPSTENNHPQPIDQALSPIYSPLILVPLIICTKASLRPKESLSWARHPPVLMPSLLDSLLMLYSISKSCDYEREQRVPYTPTYP